MTISKIIRNISDSIFNSFLKGIGFCMAPFIYLLAMVLLFTNSGMKYKKNSTVVESANSVTIVTSKHSVKDGYLIVTGTVASQDHDQVRLINMKAIAYDKSGNAIAGCDKVLPDVMHLNEKRDFFVWCGLIAGNADDVAKVLVSIQSYVR